MTIDYERSADLGAFKGYGFPAELGTDRAGYSTLITTYFRQAVDREMQKRGYTYDAKDPDLLVNFLANVRDVTDVRSTPRFGLATATTAIATASTAHGRGMARTSTRNACSSSGKALPKAGSRVKT